MPSLIGLNFMLHLHDQLIVLAIPELQLSAESFEILKVFVHQLFLHLKSELPLKAPQTSQLCTEGVKVRVSGNESMQNRMGASNSNVQRKIQKNQARLATRRCGWHCWRFPCSRFACVLSCRVFCMLAPTEATLKLVVNRNLKRDS